jgi:hypothetical protein
MAYKAKNIPQLPPATSLADYDIMIVQQGTTTRRGTVGLLKQTIMQEVTQGRDVQLRVDGGYIQWKYAGTTSWQNLISLDDLKGSPGEPGTPGSTGLSTPSFFAGDGSRTVFSPVPGLRTTNASRCMVSVGGVVQQADESYTVSLDSGGSLIFAEAPPENLPVSIQPLQ